MTTDPQPAPLTKSQRKQLIVKEINIHTRATFEHLALIVNVSEDTIRRDINELEKENLVIKVKGGAMAGAYHHTSAQKAYSQDDKITIAEKLLPLLKKDMLLLLGGGTTIREFIKLIPNSLRITIVTASVLSAVELLDKPNVRTIMLGGQISTYSQMCFSGDVFQQLSQLKTDLCILGTNALDIEGGFSDSDWDTVQVKKAMLAASDKVAIVSISEKLNSTMKIKIANLSEVDYVVTELSPDAEFLRPYKTAVPGLTFL
ncbi:Transcriptional Regulator, DeoR family protein [Pedobacter sp. BAL39]|uniref:DeoR/GlpR family DNA-binding transcription regulator n=1 Tax=Pedobacter sp. BAL39 TaxID=391596 RepID=UPI0001559A33|nr:DeoR/GlpR family DNA-binding transcription regulator [Pedobacter sp. BAL39]EDM35797.1 Transcriptional Regulator, DeoR family protein [Pedobacter sp. BAL39]